MLLDVLHIVSRTEVFALKGGTAINFFFLDYPRVSVDIDLHYLPLNEREEALLDIGRSMEVIKNNIERNLLGTKVSINKTAGKVWVRSGNVSVKLEINYVVRGVLLPPVKMPLCPSLKEEFAVSMKVSCVAKEELYAGKFCAALKRQHPRDIFDVLLFFERGEELTGETVDAFLVYLISDRKPVHEILNPRIKEIRKTYNDHFAGMARTEIDMDKMCDMQTLLPEKVLKSLTERHRTFLAGFNRGEPEWNLLSFPDAKNLPAVRWKQFNLERMDNSKRKKDTQKLEQVFNGRRIIPINKVITDIIGVYTVARESLVHISAPVPFQFARLPRSAV